VRAAESALPYRATHRCSDYRLNFFIRFIVGGGGVYYLLGGKLIKVPARRPTEKCFEVGGQVRNPSLVYGVDVEEAEVEEMGRVRSAGAESGEGR
jgi:hypothetical protein